MEFLDTVLKYWPLILFILGLIFHVIWAYFQISSHATKITDLEVKVSSNEKNSDTFREDIKVDIKEIKTALSYIKENISDLKNK